MLNIKGAIFQNDSEIVDFHFVQSEEFSHPWSWYEDIYFKRIIWQLQKANRMISSWK